MPNVRARILVTGKVQGVFFRQMLKVTAVKNDVRGWVRNLDDGRVEAVLEGERNGIDSVIEWSRKGPANSRVTNITIHDEKYTDEFSDFDVRY
ncbi:MAG: acylphosphatase [Nitrosopumilus sp. D6]|nr:MAG: acylphosphatase [Nitrosopumilus sp. D6]